MWLFGVFAPAPRYPCRHAGDPRERELPIIMTTSTGHRRISCVRRFPPLFSFLIFSFKSSSLEELFLFLHLNNNYYHCEISAYLYLSSASCRSVTTYLSIPAESHSVSSLSFLVESDITSCAVQPRENLTNCRL